MADVNYNPGARQPDNGYKPSGFLGGMLYRKDRQRYDDVSSVQDYMTGLSAQDQQAKLMDYLYAAKSRESGYDLSTAVNRSKLDTPGYQQSARAGEMGLNQTQAAAGAHDTTTLPGRIGATISNNETTPALNRAKAAEAETTVQGAPGKRFSEMMTYMDNAASMFGSDLQGQMAYQQFRQSVPPEIQRVLPEQYGPAAGERVKGIREIINRKHNQEMEKVREQGKSQLAVAKEYGKSRLAVAATKSGQFNSAAARFNEAVRKGNKDAIEATGKLLLASDELEPQERAAVLDVMKNAGLRIDMNTAARVPAPIVPGMGGFDASLEAVRRAREAQQSGAPQGNVDFNSLK